METVKVVSFVLLYVLMGLNAFACVMNTIAYRRNRRLSKRLNELIEFFEEKTNILNDNNYKEK